MAKYKNGLTVMRAQPPHIGHFKLIDRMLEDCEKVIIAIGSTQEFGTSRNPLPYNERKKMIKNYYRAIPQIWNKITIVGVEDIFNEMQWPDHVLNIAAGGASDGSGSCSTYNVDAYYCGTEYDGHWFEGKVWEVVLVDRTKQPFVSGSMIREMLLYKHPDWKKFVPECNWKLIENHFYRERE